MALDITFVGIKPNGKCFDFSVVNNAKVDVINFILTTPLDSVNTLEQLSNFNAYVKVQSAGGDYIDKISATSTYDSESEELKVSFTLHKKTTSYKNIALQLQFENLQNEVISQTEIVALSLKGTINADKEISDKYPEAIQELEKEVGSYSGRIEEVEEKVANAVLKTDIVDNLDSEATDKVLSAKQGKVLNDKISSAISGVYKPQGTTTVATLNALNITEEMNGFVYDMLDSGTLTKGSVKVMEGDNVAIIWNKDKTDWKWDKLSGLVDLSNYPTKNGNNEFSGDNRFSNGVEIGGGTNNTLKILCGIYNGLIRLGATDILQIGGSAIYPYTSRGLDLGLVNRHFKEGFIDKITDAKGSYDSDNTINSINASDIGGTFNEAQRNILSNGKPTLIKGTFLNYNNLFVFNVSKDFGGYYVCLFKTEMANGRPNISCFRVNKNNGVYAEYPSYLGISVLFGRQLPNYPTAPTIPQIPICDTDNTLKYVDTPNANIDEAYDSTRTYNSGDTCIYENHLYKCNSDNTTGTWDSSKWDRTTVAELVADETIVRTNTNQEIGGEKIFNLPLKFKFGNYIYKVDDGQFGQLFIGNQNGNGIRIDGNYLRISNLVIGNKNFPPFPSDTTKNYRLEYIGGQMVWVEY